MAVEVQMRYHLHSDEDSDDVPFRFNFLHDLESVFWMFLWYLFNYIPFAFEASQASETSETSEAYKQNVQEFDRECGILFTCSDIHSPGGRTAIMITKKLKSLSNSMKRWKWYDTVLPLVDCIVEIRRCLRDAYEKLEMQDPQEVVDGVPRWSMEQFTGEPYVKIHESVERALKELSEGAHPAVSFGILAKRARDEAGSEEAPSVKKRRQHGETDCNSSDDG